MLLFLKNLCLTLIVPATVAVYMPLLISRGRSLTSGALLPVAATIVAIGAVTYGWCVWDFASVTTGSKP